MSENNLDAALREIADLHREMERVAEDHQRRWSDMLRTIERLDDIRQFQDQRIKALEKQAMRSGSQVVTMRPSIQPQYRTLGAKLPECDTGA